MSPERFAALAEAYGGDPARWPEREGVAARAWLAIHPEGRVAVDEAFRLDAVLAAYVAAAPGADLQRRIVTRLLAERRLSPRVAGWLAALAAMIGAGALGAGAMAGAAIVAVAPAAAPDNRASGIYEQTSFGDLGSPGGPAQDAAGA